MRLMDKWSFIFLFAIFSSILEVSYSCFTENDTKHKVIESGSSFVEDCVCDNPELSTHNIEWHGPDDQIIGPAGPGQTKLYTERGHKSISLFIHSASRALSGKYKCVSRDRDGRQYERSLQIEVYDPLYIIPTNISPQYLIKGQDSFIHLTARANSEPYTWWYKDDFTKIPNDTIKYLYTREGLLIKNVSAEDEGVYRCQITVDSTGELAETIIEVEIMTPPMVEELKAKEKDVINEGNLLVLDCKASGYPIPTYSWRKISEQLQNSSNQANESWVQDVNKLIFESVTMKDQGTYECTAKNNAGESRKNISIQVHSAPNITEFNDQIVEEGAGVSIVCSAIGRPLPEINITYYGPNLIETSPEYQNNTNNDNLLSLNLTFEKVHRTHEGNYSCDAVNEVGSDEKQMYLKVYYKPFYETPKEVVWTWDDRNVNLTCDYNAQPEGDISWSFEGNTNANSIIDLRELFEFWGAKVKKTKEKILKVIPSGNNFYGTYACRVNNSLGEATKLIILREGVTPARLNSSQINITDLTATSVTFYIEEIPTDDGPPLIGYIAEYDKVDNYDVTDIHTNRTWAINVPYKIDKLESNTEYQIRFAAVNDKGAGYYSDYINFSTPENFLQWFARSAPEPLSPLDESEQIIISADNKILKLKSPEHNGDPIDYFSIRYCRVDNKTECIEEVVPPTTELNLDDLSSNTSYVVEMVAHNSVGNSTPVSLRIYLEASEETESLLSAEATILIAAIVVILCILILDVILYFTLKKGMIATCVQKKNKKKFDKSKQSRDKKGLLKDKGDPVDTLKRPDNGHKEFEYNKNTGVITGKHSAV